MKGEKKMKIVDYNYVKENNGMWASGNYDINDFIIYLVNDELVKVKVDKEFLREKIFELEKLIVSMAG